MKSRVLINDTAEATFTRLSDGHKVLMHETQLASLSQTVSEEKLKGGIGNGTIALLRTDKEMELSVRNALWDAEYLAMTQGAEFKNNKTFITKAFKATVGAEDVGGLHHTVTIDSILGEDGESVKYAPTDTASGASDKDKPRAVLGDGSEQKPVSIKTSAFEATKADFPSIKEGDIMTVYAEVEVTGEVATFDSKKFGEKYRAEYYTIAYDPETMEVVQDIFIIFDEVIPSGNFDMSFENGTAMTPEINFTVTNPKGSSELGRIVRVDATTLTP